MTNQIFNDKISKEKEEHEMYLKQVFNKKFL